MKTYSIPHTDLNVSRLALGCMKMGGHWNSDPFTQAEVLGGVSAMQAALEHGINFFDHADIYCMGKSEQVFGEALRQSPGLRQQIIVQSKCGIRFGGQPESGSPPRFDFSYEHIVNSVEGSLRRLGAERLDVLLLHRPDPLVEPEEVGRAFSELHQSGKVRYFGVSNHTAAQIALLQKYLDQPILFNQVEFNLLHSYLISDGILADMAENTYAGVLGTLDYCRLHEITVQAWAPVAQGRIFNLRAEADERTRQTAALIGKLAEAKGVSREAIALAWILRHPAKIQPIIGTTDPKRIAASCQADQVELNREEWWALFNTGRGAPPP
jgi:predicted oxidoreductase